MSSSRRNFPGIGGLSTANIRSGCLESPTLDNTTTTSNGARDNPRDGIVRAKRKA